MTYLDAVCPACGERKLHIVRKLRAAQVGEFSLAGAQVKFSAKEWSYLVCDHCGIEAEAKL